MNKTDFDAARTYALDRLQQELPPWLAYHSLSHTRETVIPAADKIAKQEDISDYERNLVLTGAAFHDLGFTITYAGHEKAGAQIARQVLPGWGFSREEVQAVEGMILATILPQSPHTLLECIVADADLAVLGQAGFLELNASLRKELESAGKGFTDAEWYGSQIKFLQTHHYFTASARAWLDARKLENSAALAALLSESALVDPN